MNFEDFFKAELDRKLGCKVILSNEYLAYRELRLQGFYPDNCNSNILIEVLEVGKKPKIGKFNYELKAGRMRSNSKQAIKIYKDYWFGVKGSYRKEDLGVDVVFDKYETNYILENWGEEYQDLEGYDVYKIFRDNGYIVKEGYKYGGLFRIYNLDYSRDSNQHSIYIYNNKYVLNALDLQRIVRIIESVNKRSIFPYKPSKQAKEKFIMKKNDKCYGIYLYTRDSKINLSAVVDSSIKNIRDPLILILDRENDLLKLGIKLLKIRDKYFIEVYRIKI